MVKIKYERKVGEPTTAIITCYSHAGPTQVIERTSQSALLDALDAQGKLGVWIGPAS